MRFNQLLKYPEIDNFALNFQQLNPKQQEVDLRLISTKIGIEIEVEGLNPRILEKRFNFWRVVEDHSLRNNHAGIGAEFVSVPVWGKYIPLALEEIESYLSTKEENHNFSERTSVHIHLNIQNFTQEQLKVLLLAYAAVEPILFSFAGRERLKNIFCVPLLDTHVFKEIMQELTFNKRNYYKYMALNINPIQTFGTIEFRHMKGNMDIHNILTWINLIFSLKKYAFNTTLENAKQEILNLNTNSMWKGWVQKLFGRYFYKLSSWNHEDLRNNICAIKYCLDKSRFERELDKEKNTTRYNSKSACHQVIDGGKNTEAVCFLKQHAFSSSFTGGHSKGNLTDQEAMAMADRYEKAYNDWKIIVKDGEELVKEIVMKQKGQLTKEGQEFLDKHFNRAAKKTTKTQATKEEMIAMFTTTAIPIGQQVWRDENNNDGYRIVER